MSGMSRKKNNHGELVIGIPTIFIICILYNKYGLIEWTQHNANLEIYTYFWISDLFCNNINEIFRRPFVTNDRIQ